MLHACYLKKCMAGHKDTLMPAPPWIPSQDPNAAASSVPITTSNILHFQQLPCIFLVSVPYKWGGYNRLKKRFLVRISMLPPPMSRLLPSGILHFQQPLCTISLHPVQMGYNRLKRRFLVRISMLPPLLFRLLPQSSRISSSYLVHF